MRVWVGGVRLVALALLAAGCSGEDGPVVELERVVSGNVTQVIAAPARIEPRRRVAVTAPLGGQVAEVLVDDGDRVGAGDPLLVLSSESLDLQLAQAEAAVAAADALSGAAVAVDLSPVLRAVREQLETIVPDVLSSLSEEVDALEGPARQEALERLAEATARYEASRANLLAAERDAASSARRASEAQRAAAAAQRDQAQAALEAAEERRGDLTLTAPVGGVVELGRVGGPPAVGGGDELSGLLGGTGGGAGPLAAGGLVAPGQVVATVYDLDGFHARVDVDEIDAVLVEPGQAATVLVDAFPDVELRGRVQRVAIAPETGEIGGVVFPVQVDLPHIPPDVRLRVGLTASAEIEVLEVDGDTVVPSAALTRRDGQEVVLVARDGAVAVVPVEVVAIGEDRAAVTGDLAVGDRVVTVGTEDLDDGDPLP